jgi:POLQ-like helicase
MVKRLLKETRGIDKMYDWQEEILRKMMKTERNLIYSVPTSGGKTLVAEIMIFRELLLHQRNVVLILPYISIVQEKMRSLIPFSVKCDFTLEEFAGTKGKIPCVKRRSK